MPVNLPQRLTNPETIPVWRRSLGMEGSSIGMGGGFGARRPDVISQTSGAAELACRMPASWRADCPHEREVREAISVTVQQRDSTQRHIV